jgi:hypothetical protein
MDALDHVMATADPLLRRVDHVLGAVGAPADHGVWGEVRRVRLLPGDAARAVVALRAAGLAEASPSLRAEARAYADLAGSLPPAGEWRGDAADAYDDARRRAATHLSGRPDSLDERLAATADLADALADWMTRTRVDLAATLAEVVGSAEAVSLTLDAAVDPAIDQEVLAAAEMGERVLRSVADSYDLAAGLLAGSAELAVAIPA